MKIAAAPPNGRIADLLRGEMKGGLGCVEFPQSQARASKVIPTQVLQGTR